MDNDDCQSTDPVTLNSYRLERTGGMIHSELQALHSYWDQLRGGRATPMRSDIDPRDMRCDARNLFIMEDLGRGNIRFRLAGTAIVNAFGMELRGMNARAIMSTGSRESFTALIGEVLEDPGVGYARLRSARNESDLWEVNLLPLRSDFGMIDRIIGWLHPLSDRGEDRFPGPLRFRIEQMSVTPVSITVRDQNLPERIPGFSEPHRPFTINAGEPVAPTLEAIDGGLNRSDDRPTPPSRGHLRLVKS